jgi:hypothetical protein
VKRCPCYLGPCEHGMARPQVADGGHCLQIDRVAANILNEQQRIADMGWSPAWGLGERIITPHCISYEMFHKSCGIWLAEWLLVSQEGLCSMELNEIKDIGTIEFITDTLMKPNISVFRICNCLKVRESFSIPMPNKASAYNPCFN